MQSLLSPTRPQDKSFADLLTVLRQHFDPTPLVIGGRFHFYKRSQRATESVAEFQADLRKLSIRREFGDFLDQVILDRFVCGVKSDTIQKKLLAEDGLTAARELEIAQSIEAADKNARELKANERSISGEEELLHFARAERKDCWHCSRRHDEKTCKFRGATCHKCGKVGHIAPVCRSVARLIDKEGQPPKPRFSNKSTRRSKFSSTKWLGTDDCYKESPNEELSTYVVEGVATQPPINVDMEIAGKTVTELDTGESVTLMSEKFFRQLYPSLHLQKCKVALKTCSGEKLHVLGKNCMLWVKFLSKSSINGRRL